MFHRVAPWRAPRRGDILAVRSLIAAPLTFAQMLMTSLTRASRLFVMVVVAAQTAVVGSTAAHAQLARRGVVSDRDVRRLLFALADDSLQGRATGTPGSARAARIIADEMRRIGLQPAGDSGYFQRVAVAVSTQSRTMPNGTVVTRTRPTLYPSFAALDTVPLARRRTAVNVVGLLRGSDPVLRDSVVLIDAHYDHLGIGTAVNGDSIYNGADDDASGVVAVLESARALANGPVPRRTVLFVATTGEEVGLLGTRWFIEHPPVPLSRLVANLEIEMIGRPDSLAGGAGRAWLTGYDRSTMGASFAAAGLPIGADRRPDQQFFMRSDNIAFAQMGIPAHTLSSYNMHGDYHHPSDDAEHVDIAHMTAVVNAAAMATRLLADGAAPRWIAERAGELLAGRDRGDHVEDGLQRRAPERLDVRGVHARPVEGADLPHVAADFRRGSALRGVLEDVVLDRLILVAELLEAPPYGVCRGDGSASLPPAVGIPIEILTGRAGGVHVRLVDRAGHGRGLGAGGGRAERDERQRGQASNGCLHHGVRRDGAR